MPSPPWVAVMTQKPGAVGVAMEPETVHMAGVSERNDTVSPVPAGGGVVVTDDAVNVTGWPTVVSGGWSKVIACPRLAGPWADCRISAAAAGACGRSMAGPPTTARRQHPRSVHAQDPRTVKREATLPVGLLRPGTLPIGRGSMTALLASSQKRPTGTSVLHKGGATGGACRYMTWGA